jgi:hypothetical protein
MHRWAKTVRVSGASAIVVDPNDKMGPAARTASGNLAPKPMLFSPPTRWPSRSGAPPPRGTPATSRRNWLCMTESAW